MLKIRWFIVLMLIWMGLTNAFDWQELLAGAIISASIVVLTIKGDDSKGICLLRFLGYLPVFMKNLLLSNIDIAKRVLDPKLPVNPGIVKIQTTLTRPYQRLILANSITLTPGTVTLEMEEDHLYIHWIDASEESEKHGEIIKGEMERAISKL